MPALWIAFSVGFFLGVVAITSTLALCFVAKQSDDSMEEIAKRLSQHSEDKPCL